MAEITNGIKYLKINRLDTDGEDYGSRIINADNIKINYSDIGPVLYDILTIQQQSDYYLLGVIPQPITSSVNKILDYNVEAIRSPAGLNFNNIPTTLSSSVPTWAAVNGNSLQYFKSSSSDPNYNSYVLGNTPNTNLTFSISGSLINTVGSTVLLYLGITLNGEYIALNSASISPSGTSYNIPITLSGSVIPIENSILGFEIYTDQSNYIFVSSIYFRVTSSQPSSSPTPSLLNITPDIINFYSSDENAIINNAVTPQYSTIYQDIDYSTGLVPTNFNLLVSGNADYAPVQDSNYTATGWANSRYKGSRASSPDFNVTT
jgi:hypothetical protein